VALLIRTNATNVQPGFVSVINSGTVTRLAFEPTTTPGDHLVPEPASLAFFGIGLLGIGAAIWRRRQA